METLSSIIAMAEHIPAAVAGITAFMVFAKAVTVITPTTIDDGLFGKATLVVNVVLRILNVIALNVGKAKNKDDA